MAIEPHDDALHAVTPFGLGPMADLVHLPSAMRAGALHLPTAVDLAGGAVQRLLACGGHRETNRGESVAGRRLAHGYGGGVWAGNVMHGPARHASAAGNAVAGA